MAKVDLTVGNAIRVPLLAIVGFLVLKAVLDMLGLRSISAKIPS